MAYQYYVCTDTVNRGTILRFSADKMRWQSYNTGLGIWELTDLWLQYMYSESHYYGLIRKITEQEAKEYMQTSKSEWVKYWGITVQLVRKYSNVITSPIESMSYIDYATWISDYARDDRERIMIALGYFSLVPNYKSILKKAGLPPLIIRSVTLFLDGGAELFQASNSTILSAVFTTLKVLHSRLDLADPLAIQSRYNQLQQGYAHYEVYGNVKI